MRLTIVGPDVDSRTRCVVCDRMFVGVHAEQKTCAAPDCVRQHDLAQVRARCARRYAVIRGRAPRRQPWLLGAPIAGAFLPGGGCEIFVDPAPKWPMTHRSIRGLHGALTAILDIGHHDRFPNFALLPWSRGTLGWGVYFRTTEGMRLAGRAWNGTLWDRPTQFRFGPLVRPRAPAVTKRGRQRVAIETITPVCIKATMHLDHDKGCRYRLVPTSDSLRSALGQQFAARVGVRPVDDDAICLTVIEHSTDVVHTQIGDKFGDVPGWMGRVVVEVNAVARWMLEAAARGPGLGSRVGFGFGRIQVVPC